MESLADFLGVKLQELPDHQPVDASRAAALSIEERAKKILESPEYFESVLHRIRLGSLPPAIELRFYDYAYGKMADRVEHSGKVETVTEVRRVVVHVDAPYGQHPSDSDTYHTH